MNLSKWNRLQIIELFKWTHASFYTWNISRDDRQSNHQCCSNLSYV